MERVAGMRCTLHVDGVEFPEGPGFGFFFFFFKASVIIIFFLNIALKILQKKMF